ncbi:MAG: Gfo/Idh/MocA family oxidoreductase [Salinivirgaceae bacterium]
MNKIKWGILGCGDVTEFKSGPAFNLVSNSELVAVMRRDAAKAEDYAKRHGVPKWYSNADDLINDPEVNAVYVATPPNAHAALTIKALKAGKPVYVEKPMALNFSECQQMIQASEKYHTPLFVAYYRRALPGFLKVKELVENGSIGKVRLVNLQLYKSLSNYSGSNDLLWRVDPKMSGGGHFFDLASHQLDFMDFVFGPVQKVNSFALNQAKKYEAEDIISASFLMPENVLVNGTWCFTVPEFLERDIIEIIGEKGTITYSCFDFVPVELRTAEGKQTFEFTKPKHVQQNMIQLVVNDLLGKGKSPSNGISGARTNWVMDEVVKEFYTFE